jgi:hypothetical protein
VVLAGCELSLDNTSDLTDEAEDIGEDLDPDPEPPPPPPDNPPPGENPNTVVPKGEVLVNPVMSEGDGMENVVYWKIYNPPHLNRKVSIRWPSDLYNVYGARPENTTCVADGTSFEFYQLDTGEDGTNARLSYTCTTRYGYEFPHGVIPIMYMNGSALAAFSVQNPADPLQTRLPATQQLP